MKCSGQRSPLLGERPDFYIGDEPIWVCLRCGGCGCPDDAPPAPPVHPSEGDTP